MTEIEYVEHFPFSIYVLRYTFESLTFSILFQQILLLQQPTLLSFLKDFRRILYLFVVLSMGIELSKLAMGDQYPLFVINSLQAGAYYLCVHSQNELAVKRKHNSLFIDAAGEFIVDNMGSIHQLIGLMLHVTAKSSTGRTKFCHGKSTITEKKDSVHIVGKLFKPQFITPIQVNPAWQDPIRFK